MTAPSKPSSTSEGAAVAPAATTAGGEVPDFFVVGHQKCGTTALYLMLSEHPQIFMPRDVKEPWFFARELRPGSLTDGAQGRHSRPETLEQYVALFADAAPGQLVGEASPQYIRSETAAAEIAALRPDARIVAILREPASFLRSLHLQLVATHIESETDFARAIALEPKRREGKQLPRRSISPQSLLYSDHVHYTEQLRRLHAAFPPEQVLVLIYDDFRADNEGTVREVLRFLQLDATAPIETVETKPLKAVRSMRLHQLRRAIRHAHLNPSAGSPLLRAYDRVAPRRLRSDAIAAGLRRAAYAPQAPADDALALELRRRFKGEVQAASEYLGRDLVALWGYDRIS
jgi:sulfotransferase family protein